MVVQVSTDRKDARIHWELRCAGARVHPVERAKGAMRLPVLCPFHSVPVGHRILQAVITATQIAMDDKVSVFSWVDDVFFIAKRALDRAASTHSELATAPTLNTVFGESSLRCGEPYVNESRFFHMQGDYCVVRVQRAAVFVECTNLPVLCFPKSHSLCSLESFSYCTVVTSSPQRRWRTWLTLLCLSASPSLDTSRALL